MVRGWKALGLGGLLNSFGGAITITADGVLAPRAREHSRDLLLEFCLDVCSIISMLHERRGTIYLASYLHAKLVI